MLQLTKNLLFTKLLTLWLSIHICIIQNINKNEFKKLKQDTYK